MNKKFDDKIDDKKGLKKYFWKIKILFFEKQFFIKNLLVKRAPSKEGAHKRL